MLTSAYWPLSAVLMTDDVHAHVVSESGKRGDFGHGFTYSEHPVAVAVAREVLAICPPLIITLDEIDVLFERVGTALRMLDE